MTAVRDGSASCSTSVGTENPNASGTGSSRGGFAGAVERLVQVNVVAEQSFNRQGDLQRNKGPLEETCLAEGKIIRIDLRVCHTGQLEDDHNPRLVGARVVFAHDSCFPEPPHIGDFFRQIGSDVLHCDPGLEPVVGDDAHHSSLYEGRFPLARTKYGNRPSRKYRPAQTNTPARTGPMKDGSPTRTFVAVAPPK